MSLPFRSDHPVFTNCFCNACSIKTKYTQNLPIFSTESTSIYIIETTKPRVAVVDNPNCSKDWTFRRETATLLWMVRNCRDVTLGIPSADRWNRATAQLVFDSFPIFQFLSFHKHVHFTFDLILTSHVTLRNILKAHKNLRIESFWSPPRFFLSDHWFGS